MHVPKGLESIRLSQTARDQLIRLKRTTGIQHWNVLCRWALLTSMSAPTEPPNQRIAANSSVEMDWRTFAGEWGDVYLGLLLARYDIDDVETKFKQHLHRGVTMLLNLEVRSLSGLLEAVVRSENV